MAKRTKLRPIDEFAARMWEATKHEPRIPPGRCSKNSEWSLCLTRNAKKGNERLPADLHAVAVERIQRIARNSFDAKLPRWEKLEPCSEARYRKQIEGECRILCRVDKSRRHKIYGVGAQPSGRI
ncbi:MAG: hypothetical protein NZ554_04515 [Bryobacteraceae bacterium]|nr:hypothetical protein [Bryobacteraceae bacterium]